MERRAAGCVDRIVEFGYSQGAAVAIQLAHAGRDASMYRGFPGEPQGYVQPADEGWTTVGPSAVAYPGAPCASCADHRGDRRRGAGVGDAARRSDRAGSTSLRFTPPMAICCTSSSRRCRIRAPTGTGVISPGGPGYQVPFARSVPGGRSQDRRGGDAGWAASG